MIDLEWIFAPVMPATIQIERFHSHEETNPAAYDCFSRGRELWHRLTKQTNSDARDLLQRAVELDPNFASAHAFLALTHGLDYLNRWRLRSFPSHRRTRRNS
ncbi:hypothetical protein ACU8OJ_04160 [Rhizobium leguminosarum]